MTLRALDLFCSAGGVSMGLHRAGIEVVGVDIRPQPNYPFAFAQADALALPFSIEDFDFIWASPHCQRHTSLRNVVDTSHYPDQIPAVRAMLQASGKPYVIENVPGAPLRNPARLCGSLFRLGVRRHRLFETNFGFTAPRCRHKKGEKPIDVSGEGTRRSFPRQDPSAGGSSRKPLSLAEAREVMGIDWMTRAELSQAIPPAYSEFIARAWLAQRQAVAA